MHSETLHPERMCPEKLEFIDGLPVIARIYSVEHYPFHWHNALEIIMVLEGEAVISMGCKTHLLKENDIAVVNINEIHRIQKNGGDNKLLIIQVDSAFCSTIPNFQNTLIYCCSPCHGNLAHERYNTLKENVLLLVSWIIEGADKIHIIGCLDDTLIEMADYFDYLQYGSGAEAFDEKRVKRFKYIYESASNSPGNSPNLTELAKTMGITMQYLSYDIRDKFELSFQELLFQAKCMKAAKLLIGTGKSVNDIAAECGFSDVKYLVKHFESYFYCKPLDFRKIHGLNGESTAARLRYKEILLSCFREKILKELSQLKTLNTRMRSLKIS